MKSKLLIFPLIFVIAFSLWYFQSYKDIEFQKEKWHNSNKRQRYRMANDILLQKTFIGFSKEEIKEVLGPFEDHFPFPNFLSYNLNCGEYKSFYLFAFFKLTPKQSILYFKYDSNKVIYETGLIPPDFD